jgi:hypothetical protein
MIYHKWKLIFIGIPKNASTSFHFALRNKTDYWSLEHNHDTIFDEFEKHDEDFLLHYNSFCVVRNPYDRFFSAWKFAHPHPGSIELGDYKNSFNKFVEGCLNEKFREQNINSNHYTPQYKFVTMNKRILVDDILRYEKLNEEWILFQSKWNDVRKLPYKMNLALFRENDSGIRIPWNEIYDEKSREIIYDLYHTDFETFNYSK